MATAGALALSPPEFFQLAGHPLRWQLLRELASSDRTVQELCAAVDGAQNLVSYHLAKLRDAGLVVTRRSSADGRDTYYSPDLLRIRALMTTGADALHPGLIETAPGEMPERRRPVRVLFLCTGNSARSQMAEALIRHRAGGDVDACSAGSHPKALHPNAVHVMLDQYGIDLAGHEPKQLSVFADQHFDWVITLCDRVREVCPEFPGNPKAIHWSIPDPAAGGGDDESTYPAFQRTAAELETRIAFLLSVITNSTPAH